MTQDFSFTGVPETGIPGDIFYDNIRLTEADPQSGGDTFTLTSASCGTAGSLSNSSFDGVTGAGSFDCGFPDGPAATTVSVTVSDDDGDSGTDSLPVTITNVPPTFEAGPDETLEPPVAGVFSRSGITFTDPGADVWSGTVNFGDGTGDLSLPVNESNKAFDLAHTFTAEGTFTVTVTLDDGDGGSNNDSFFVTVNLNTPPVADTGGPYSGDEGSAISLSSATAFDSDGDPLTLSWSVDTSPTSATCTFSDATVLDPDLTCNDNGTFTVTLTADDGTAAPVSSDATVTVNNVAPSVGPVSVPTDPIDINDQPVTGVSASFTDDGTNDTHTCTADYGDGTSPQTGTATGGACTFPDGHSYTAAGVYEVTVEVTDDDLDSGSATATEFIVIYNPDGGFVTGGGWIDSPEGACPVFCEDATGKARLCLEI